MCTHVLKAFLVLAVTFGLSPANAQNIGNKLWKGAFSTSITYCGNYSTGVCPADTDNVEVPMGCSYNPVLLVGQNFFIRDLNLSANSYVVADGSTPTPGSFTIYGHLYVSGDLFIHFPTKLIIKPGGTVTIMGNTMISSPAGSENSMLVIENNGSFISGCNISYTPYNTPPYHGTGYPLVYRQITQDLKWHFLSSPVLTQPIANKDFAPSPNNFLLVPNTAWDFYKWLSTCPDPPYDENWRNLRNPDGTQNYMEFGYPSYFESGKGYLVAYDNWHQNNSVFINNETKAFYGPLNSCCEGFDFHNAITQCSYFWELIGNPFTSAIEWGMVTEKYNLVSDFYYIYNDNKPGGPGYEYWSDYSHHSAGVDGYIPMAQGFFVQVLTDGGRYIGLPLTARIHHNSTDHWLKDTPANKLKVTFGNGTNFDETYLLFESGSAAGRDRQDAEKMFSLDKTVPQVYSVVDNSVKTAFNSMPYTESPVTVPLGILAPADGNYNITLSGMENFTSLAGLVLEDLLTNTSQDMIANPVYSFSAGGNEDAGRFLLHLSGTIGINDNHGNLVNVYSSGNTIFIASDKGLHNAQVTVSNLLGQQILTRSLKDQPLNQVAVNAREGYYIVKVQDNSSVKTTKVFIK
jgi:hypothetical protein